MFDLVGFAIGNGESRQGLQLEKLRGRGPIFGCNALYRDFSPDILFVRDREMIKEVEEKYEGVKGIVRSSGDIFISDGRRATVPSTFNLTGVTMLYAMCNMHANLKRVYLIGFDSVKKYDGYLTNNVYKDTSNYKKSSESGKPLLCHSIKDVSTVMFSFPWVEFCCVNDDASDNWKAFKGFSLISRKEFLNRIKNNEC